MARPDIAAFHFPNWHRDPRNEARHGQGWTEWELVKQATPRFPGHQQPKVPAWGCVDEADPAWAAREIDLAADHGVDVFLYDWYWHAGGPFLQRQLEEGFLRAPNRQRMRFALMWANHDWVDMHPWDGIAKPETQMAGAIGRATWEQLTDHVVARYFSQPEYYRIDGRPVFSIYELATFLRGLGGVAGAREALDAFRAKARAAGLPGIHLNAIVWGIPVLPAEHGLDGDRNALLDALGVDSATSYCWAHHVHFRDFPATDYAWAAGEMAAMRDGLAGGLRVPYFPNVSMGWDASPRTVQTVPFTNRGYPFMPVLTGNTPAAFRAALESARAWCAGRSGHQLVTINAWNEWTEGSYLLPDTTHGNAYVEQVRAVFGR
jgi:hypothetical protein